MHITLSPKNRCRYRSTGLLERRCRINKNIKYKSEHRSHVDLSEIDNKFRTDTIEDGVIQRQLTSISASSPPVIDNMT